MTKPSKLAGVTLDGTEDEDTTDEVEAWVYIWCDDLAKIEPTLWRCGTLCESPVLTHDMSAMSNSLPTEPVHGWVLTEMIIPQSMRVAENSVRIRLPIPPSRPIHLFPMVTLSSLKAAPWKDLKTLVVEC